MSLQEPKQLMQKDVKGDVKKEINAISFFSLRQRIHNGTSEENVDFSMKEELLK